ncbi:MAG TPA: hypothetical protein VFV38_02835 [Ktedonobacteraceae bacterium]|nr:hypothetical protein [Ktedonobacteraceae bacterium]
MPRCLLRDPLPQFRRPVCHSEQVHPPHHLAALGHQQVEVIRPGGLRREQLRMLRVELSEERVPPIRYYRREVGPILPLERKQGRRVIEAEQLKVWQGARCRFRSASPVLLRFRVCGFPTHGLPPDTGTCTALWHVSFVHVFLPLLHDELLERVR